VLTAIVISFGMTAVLMILAIGGNLVVGHDRVDVTDRDEREEDGTSEGTP
jgi:multisubunit Na+/H+ antiporter MnhC subunit